MYSRKVNLAKSNENAEVFMAFDGTWRSMGTVFGKQLELDQIVGCSTIFSYKATQTPKHSS